MPRELGQQEHPDGGRCSVLAARPASHELAIGEAIGRQHCSQWQVRSGISSPSAAGAVGSSDGRVIVEV
jgi:hypothetical protein